MPRFRPIVAGAHLRERVVACGGAGLGIAFALVAAALLPIGGGTLPLIVAPIGASAVLAFAVPTSPLAQPWPVIGGNVLSTLAGVTVFEALGSTTVAAGLAVGLAVMLMSLCRCLHPPGGAAALFAVIGGAPVHAAGFAFAFVPVGVNSVALVAAAMLFHRLTGHSYPHRPTPAPRSGLLPADIDRALDDMGESFDITREDLQTLLAHAELHARARVGVRPAPPR